MSVIEPDGQGVQRATIAMDSYSYTPNELSVQAGHPVELILQNEATFISHMFVIADPAAGLHVHLDVSAGDSQTVQFTPMTRGTFPFYCDKKLCFLRAIGSEVRKVVSKFGNASSVLLSAAIELTRDR